eukprot:PITA_07434
MKHSFIELQTQDISLDNEVEIKKSVNGVTSKTLRSEDSDALPLLSIEKSGIAEVAFGSGIPSAVFNLATTVIGAGIMALPATMKVLGLPLCFAVIILMGILSEISIELLVEFSVRLKASNYGETVESVCGHSARVLSEICIIVNNAGIMIVYLIIMGDVMSGSSHHQGLFDQWTGKEGWWSDQRLIVFITMVFVLAPLCALKKIDSLKFTSATSVALAVVFVVLSSIIAFVRLIEGKIERPRLLPDVGSKRAILDLLVVIPIMTSAYICHFNVQPIYNEMQDRTPAKMNRVGRITTVLCVLVYKSTAISGYLLFGRVVERSETDSFHHNVVFVVLSSIIAFVRLIEGKIERPRLLPDVGSKRAILDLLVVIPIMTNAYICHFNVQPIYNEMQDRTPAKMNRVGRITTALCVLVYESTAISGYLLFGQSTDSDILSNFDKDLEIPFSSILDNIIRVGYVLHLMLVFPVIHFHFGRQWIAWSLRDRSPSLRATGGLSS